LAAGSFFNGLDVGVPHIHGNGFNALSLPGAEAVEEMHQGLGSAALADVEDAAGFVVEHHGQVAVALADRDLVDRYNIVNEKDRREASRRLFSYLQRKTSPDEDLRAQSGTIVPFSRIGREKEFSGGMSKLWK